MYSYKDRIRAVQLYIKLDKRIRATIRQLGYPTKNALKSWHREYERRSALPEGYAAGRCASRVRKAGRMQADAVQLEESATRPRGARIHETPEPLTTMT